MKTTVKLILLALTVTMISCSKSNDDNTNPSNSSGNKTEQVAGNWMVTYYFDSGKDETNNYSGYNFTFNLDGTLTATTGSGSFTGTWWIGSKSSDDDNSSNRFNIAITGNKAMDDLQDDWVILSLNEKVIDLMDDNTTSGEKLRFER